MDSQQSQETTSYTTRLDKTLRALQKRVKEQEALLQQLRASSTSLELEPSSNPDTHLLQLRSLKAAYDSITTVEPWLPSPESPLPALLALRNTDKCIRDTQECITTTETNLKAATQRLEREKTNLNDAKLIQRAIHDRSESLQETINTQTQKTPMQIAKDMLNDMNQKKDHYDTETGKLVSAFNKFIDDHLAVMLAAEQLGGPVAGQDPKLTQGALEGGFSTQGKPKKSKSQVNVDKRQQRIDQVWGAKPIDDEEGNEEPWDEKTAAAAEMRELTEELLNHLVEAGGKGPGTYVQLQQDSAAARFLVRAKVAQFHPTNGTRLRLFDFGGEIDESQI